jgi:hypothetical protein
MWLLKGDNNTAFFHRVANGKKGRIQCFSYIIMIKLLKVMLPWWSMPLNFTKNFFGPSDSSDIHLDPDCWEQSKIVSEQENGELEKPFVVNEIKEVIFSMEKNTAPGPDHFPIEFYQHCWDFIKNDLVALFHDFHNLKLDIGRFNYGIFTLLPKVKEANNIKQYRPICLLNVIYKVFTKALMLRLEKVMSRIINKSQSGFLKNRNIMDGVMALHEILHDTRLRKKDGLVLKLDFEKAYDKLN